MTPDVPVAYVYIDTPSALSNAVKKLETASHIAVDLEADSLYHYHEKVCLVQMATETVNLVIDPLVLKDLSPLKPLFENNAIQKIFHGADYDVRSLYRDFGFVIHNLFDTELASRFLGIPGTGLESIVQQYVDVQLNKKYQKKDWSKRPLPEPMVEYAAQDVIYLLPIARQMIDELRNRQRLSWVVEECAYLSTVRMNQSNSLPLYLKFKGAGRLSSKALAVLENVLQFRKKIAQAKDKPLFKIFSNKVALTISMEQPNTLHSLEKLGVMGKAPLAMYGEDLVLCVKEGLEMDAKEQPVYPKKKAPKLPSQVPPRVKALQKWRQDKAAILNMDAGLICNRALITQIAIQNPKTTEELLTVEDMKNWQREALGKEIIEVLRSGKGEKTRKWKKK